MTVTFVTVVPVARIVGTVSFARIAYFARIVSIVRTARNARIVSFARALPAKLVGSITCLV